MFYEVRATMFFKDQDKALDFYLYCGATLGHAHVVNPGTASQECSSADYILCRHDDHPPEACTLNRHVENSPGLPDVDG